MRGFRREREKSGADDGSDAERDQIHGPERALQLMFAALAFAHDAGDWFRGKKTQFDPFLSVLLRLVTSIYGG